MDRKRRAKTGCRTCRQRRVKCDERKPFCRRCETANISCDGYPSPRVLIPPGRYKNSVDTIEDEPPSFSFPTVEEEKFEPPLFACPSNPEPCQRPHQRAREILGHQQYSSRTAKLLFRDNHLHFWRDHLLTLAWDIEYVFDAIIALGIMHRAVIMLSDPSDKWRGLDNKVVAFQIYANALKKLAEISRGAVVPPAETLIAVLLLLAYFEVR
jgi:hypothetical protein